ncbi:clr5 domain protein [Apiospora aurea]|uniref:Clr5 domain protein n=1 Tax=Apiospora aurea TaxID=335848 RepID=A0ABR1QAE3_9PEZI
MAIVNTHERASIADSNTIAATTYTCTAPELAESGSMHNTAFRIDTRAPRTHIHAYTLAHVSTRAKSPWNMAKSASDSDPDSKPVSSLFWRSVLNADEPRSPPVLRAGSAGDVKSEEDKPHRREEDDEAERFAKRPIAASVKQETHADDAGPYDTRYGRPQPPPPPHHHHHPILLPTGPAAAAPSAASASASASSASSATRRPIQQYPAEVWETHKAHLHHLYIQQGKSLKQIQQIMAQQGFNASDKMYKDRFSKWGFRKNRRALTREKAEAHQGNNAMHVNHYRGTSRGSTRTTGMMHAPDCCAQYLGTTATTTPPRDYRQKQLGQPAAAGYLPGAGPAAALLRRHGGAGLGHGRDAARRHQQDHVRDARGVPENSAPLRRERLLKHLEGRDAALAVPLLGRHAPGVRIGGRLSEEPLALRVSSPAPADHVRRPRYPVAGRVALHRPIAAAAALLGARPVRAVPEHEPADRVLPAGQPRLLALCRPRDQYATPARGHGAAARLVRRPTVDAGAEAAAHAAPAAARDVAPTIPLRAHQALRLQQRAAGAGTNRSARARDGRAGALARVRRYQRRFTQGDPAGPGHLPRVQEGRRGRELVAGGRRVPERAAQDRTRGGAKGERPMDDLQRRLLLIIQANIHESLWEVEQERRRQQQKQRLFTPEEDSNMREGIAPPASWHNSTTSTNNDNYFDGGGKECDARLGLAIALRRQAMDYITDMEQREHGERFEDLKVLEAWYRKMGDAAAADAAVRQSDRELERHLATLTL